MRLETKHFGEIDIDENKIILFEEGLPGFRHLTRFALFFDEEEFENADDTAANTESVFLWLQSLDDGDTAFVLLNTFMFMPDYAPKLEEGALDSLGECEPDELIIRNIAVVPDKLEDMTVNLCAPVIINSITQKGKQTLATNKEYHVKHRIIQEARAAREAREAI